MLDLKYWITDARNVSATLLRMGLDISVIRHGVPVLALVTDDGLLELSCEELLREKRSDKFQVVASSSVPEFRRLHEVTSTDAETDDDESQCEALRRLMGFSIWPEILLISNSETLSYDQASCLSACFVRQESDKSSDWPQSIVFILKKDEDFPENLSKFVRTVVATD